MMYLNPSQYVPMLPPERTATPLYRAPRRDPRPIDIRHLRPGVPRYPIMPARPPRAIPHVIRRLIPSMRFIPWVGMVPIVIDALDPLLFPRRRPGLWPNNGIDLVFKRDCGYPLDWPNGQWLGVHTAHILNCAGGQVFPAGVAWNANSSPDLTIEVAPNRTYVLCDPENTARVTNVMWWWSYGTGTATIRPFVLQPNPFPQVDPNLKRRFPTLQPNPVDPYAQPAPEPAPETRPFDPAAVPWQWSNVPPGAPAPRPHVRQPPPPNVSENKNQSRVARLGVMLWNIADVVSETTEVLDALYDALPDKRKVCEGGGVSIGQYGSDFDRCKADVLFRYFSEMNTVDAFFNLAKMVAEDMAVGQFHKFLSKLYPPGISIQRTLITHFASKAKFEAYIVKHLQALFKAWGL